MIKGNFKIIKGSIINPESSGLKYIIAPQNLKGTIGSPTLEILNKKWKKVNENVKGWYSTRTGAYKLGAIEITSVQSDVWIIHSLFQDENGKTSETGLKDALKAIVKSAKFEGANVHVSNLLLQEVPDLNKYLQSEVIDKGVSVYVYNENL